MSSLTHQDLTEPISQYYEITEPDTVLAYLQTYPFLIALLTEARQPLTECFGTESPIRLAVVHEPEASGSAELFAYVSTNLASAEALARLERFDQTWWLDAMDRARNRLMFTLEFAHAL